MLQIELGLGSGVVWRGVHRGVWVTGQRPLRGGTGRHACNGHVSVTAAGSVGTTDTPLPALPQPLILQIGLLIAVVMSTVREFIDCFGIKGKLPVH